jgi:DNA-binding LacI/PurR family transcriptional regulator
MSEKTPLTMAEVAARAGVAESTVSRALADNPLVAEKTRLRIQKLAAELGYSINPVAQSLRSQKTRVVAVAVPLVHERSQPLSDPFMMGMVAQLADALAARGYSMLLSKVPVHEEDWIGRLLLPGRADGVILIGQSFEHASINAAARSGKAVVAWGAQLPAQVYASVGTDNRLGGELAASHLLQRGRRRIAFLGDERLPEVGQRYEGYSHALRQQGLIPDGGLLARTHFRAEDALDDIREFLSAHADIDGIVAASDVIANSAIRALAESGRGVPSDVAIVGYDDIELASYANPPLTTVRQDLAEGARLLVERVLSGETAVAQSVAMTPELIVRQSS